MNFFKDLGVGAFTGMVTGACTGLGTGIWACVEYLQPALASVDGISDPAADGITAAIALFGGLELAIAAGAIGGGLAGAGIASVIDLIRSCCCNHDSNEQVANMGPGNV